MKLLVNGVMILFLLGGCATSKGDDKASSSSGSTKGKQVSQNIPAYLKGRPFELYARAGQKIVPAPAGDLAVARGYAGYQDKGAVRKGLRITIMTAKSTYQVGEKVRVIHVLEALKPGYGIHVMGPKAVREEYVNGKLASPVKGGASIYDGAVVPSPGVDFNYEVSVHTFAAPGSYTIQWRGGGHPIEGDLQLRSNTLTLQVMK